MFGSFDAPLNVDEDGISLSIEKKDNAQFYTRECLDEKVEKSILANKGKILIHPVEPLNKPKEITSYFTIEFNNNILVEPLAKRKIFIKFPIEIGVFISGKKDIEIVDIFTVMPQKFSLYGDSRNGVICRYYSSEVYSSIPEANPIHEGVMELNIINTTHKWVEVTQAVFNAYGMKIFYNDYMVSLKANFRILGEEMAETFFSNTSIHSGMKKAMELYTVRKLYSYTTKFVMEWGI